MGHKTVLSNPLPPDWLSMKEFENNNEMTDYNTIKQHEARRRHLVELENFFVNAAGGDREGQILSQQEFTLPFEVENFNSQHPYEGTGYYLEKRPVVKKRKKIRRNQSQVKIVDIMNVLVVQMVAQEKCEKKKKKKTKKTFYSKACTYQASSSSSNSDDSSSSDDDDEEAPPLEEPTKRSVLKSNSPVPPIIGNIHQKNLLLLQFKVPLVSLMLMKWIFHLESKKWS